MTTQKIHHMTTKRAASFGLTLDQIGEMVVVLDAEGNEMTSSVSARQALDRAIEMIEAERTDEEIFEDAEAADAEAAAENAAAGESDEQTDAEDDDEERITGSRVKERYKARYAAHNATCGDAMAFTFQELLYSTEDKLERRELAFKVADDNGLDDARTKYAGRNTGMVRMNIGNRLRGLIRRGQAVNINGQVFEPIVEQAAA